MGRSGMPTSESGTYLVGLHGEAAALRDDALPILAGQQAERERAPNCGAQTVVLVLRGAPNGSCQEAGSQRFIHACQKRSAVERWQVVKAVARPLVQVHESDIRVTASNA